MKAVVQTEASKILTLRVESIRPFKGQPRTHFDKQRLQELAASLKEFGQQVAIIVRQLPEPEGAVEYVVIDGERRFRAAQLAGLKAIRAEVRGASDDAHQFVQSVVANFGREDHTAMESARACARVCEMPEYAKLPASERYERVGALFARSSAWVQQHLRLNKLPQEVQGLIEGDGAGRRLNPQIATFLNTVDVSDERKVELAREIVAKGLSTPQANLLVRREIRLHGQDGSVRGRKPSDDHLVFFSRITRIRQEAESALDTNVKELRARLAANPMQRRSMLTSLDAAINALTQLREACSNTGRVGTP